MDAIPCPFPARSKSAWIKPKLLLEVKRWKVPSAICGLLVARTCDGVHLHTVLEISDA